MKKGGDLVEALNWEGKEKKEKKKGIEVIDLGTKELDL